MRPVAQIAVNAGWALLSPDERLTAPTARRGRLDGALEMFDGRENAVEAVRAWLRCGIRL
jgi:hypothetical protein